MRISTLSVAMVVAAGVALSAMSSYAGETTFTDCRAAAAEVKTAIAANAQSPNIADALKEKRAGLQFCNASLYSAGVAHYNQALKLLGASKS